VTNSTGVLRQSIYYPYAWALKHARGRVLDPLVESDSYEIRAQGLRPDFARDDQVPYVDLAATFEPDSGQACVFMLNRDLQSERELVVECRDFTPTRVLGGETLTGDDLKAANSFERPKLVTPRPLETPRAGSTLTFRLPPRSYSYVLLATA
jgi:alpha-N-arabinofuranosidase